MDWGNGRGGVKIQWLALLAAVFLLLNLYVIGNKPRAPQVENPALPESTLALPAGEDIAWEVGAAQEVYVGQPFVYHVRVLYRPSAVAPDFRRLIRDVGFAPFEQLHLTRMNVQETEIPDGLREYTLSYSILGINVIPHVAYPLMPVRLSYTRLASGEVRELRADPGTVQITGYYPPDITGVSFRPLKGTVADDYALKLTVLAAGSLLFLAISWLLIRHAAARRSVEAASLADVLRDQLHGIRTGLMDSRRKILEYERILLSLFSHYGGQSALAFWTGRRPGRDGLWLDQASRFRTAVLPGYGQDEPDSVQVSVLESCLTEIDGHVGPDSLAERADITAARQGTLRQRIARQRGVFIAGAVCAVMALWLLVLVLMPTLWRDTDAAVYNGWISSLPSRLFDESQDTLLSTVDVEMLGHLAEQQNVLEALTGAEARSRYLYNHGTIVAKAYLNVLNAEGAAQQEAEGEIGEMEAAARPSFEFPVQLLSNAARLDPHDEDGRRNLELAIMIREQEDDKEARDVPGDIGPPTPGFSRDMKQMLF